MQIVAVALAAGAVAWFVAVPRIVRSAAAGALERAGFFPVTMELPEVGLRSAQVKYILAGHRPSVAVGRVWVSYSPWTLLQGKVTQVEVQGVDVWLPLERATPVAAPPATEPAFERLLLSDARVHVPTGPQTLTVPVDLTAIADENQKLVVRLETQVGSSKISLDALASPDFSVIEGTASVAGLQAADLAAFAGDVPVEAAGVSLSVTGRLDLVAGLAELQRLEAQAATVTWKGGTATDVVAVMSGGARQVDGQWRLTLNDGGRVTAKEISVPPFGDRIQFALQLAEAAAEQGPGSTWSAAGTGGTVELAGLTFSLAPWKLARGDKGLSGSITSLLPATDVAKVEVLRRLVPKLTPWNLEGKLSGEASLTWKQGELASKGTVMLAEGAMVNNEYALSATGIEAGISMTSLFPPRAEPGQSLSVSYLQMGKWEIRNAKAVFAMPQDGVVQVQSARLGWAAGEVSCEPFEFTFANPVVRTTLTAKDLDLSKVLWVLSGERMYGEGMVQLRVPVSFKWPQIRFGDGCAEASRGSVLNLSAQASELDKWLVAADPRFATDPAQQRVRQRLVEALQQFRLEKFRADFKRQDQRLHTTITIKGAGTKGESPQEVNLNLSATDLDWLLSRYLAMPR
jgi:hypothetical protein